MKTSVESLLSCRPLNKLGILTKLILIASLSGILYYFSVEYWMLTWLAPISLCIYALETDVVLAIGAGFMAYTIGALHPSAVLPWRIYSETIIANGAAFSIALSLFRDVTIRFKHWSTSFIFAGCWTVYEFITSAFSPHGTVGSIAYTQAENLPVIQIASITGIAGVTFLLLLIPASISLAWYHRHDPKIWKKAVIIPAGLLFITVLFGHYRLGMPDENPKIKVGITAIAINMEQYMSVASNRDPKQVVNTLDHYSRNIDVLAQAGVDVVLLPEKIATINSQYDILQHLSDKALQTKTELIVGLSNRDNEKYYNSAYLFSKHGELSIKYDKQHLVPAFEGRYTPGNVHGIVEPRSMGKWGIEICKDMDFVNPALDYSQQGINIMFVPALDFHDDGWSHGRVAIMRGVEGNFAVARAGQWGLLTLSDSKGRIIQKVSTDGMEEGAFLIGEVSLGEGKSLYSRIGNWFGWFSLGLTILLGWFYRLRYKRGV